MQLRNAGFEVSSIEKVWDPMTFQFAVFAPASISQVPMESNIKGIVGMIIPPTEMRAIIDRTAEFVAKQGPEMEKKIYSSDPTRIRFAFIAKDNPFHPYYAMAIQCYKEGRSRF